MGLKEKYEATFREALDIMDVTTYDAIEDPEERRLASKRMCQELMKRTGVSYETARRHIARAARRQRAPDYQPPAANWGGARLGAGRPPMSEDE